MEMIYKKSKQVYESIIDEELAELNERIEQFDRDIGRKVRVVETMGRDGIDIPKSSGARADVIEEVVLVVDINSMLLINFDEFDFEEDLDEDSDEDPEEEPEEDFEEDPEEVVEPYEDNVGDGYDADMEREIVDRNDTMSYIVTLSF